MNEISENNSTVFEDNIGKFTKSKGNSENKENSNSLFHRARPVPYNLQGAVEDELKYWEEMNIIERIEKDEPTPDWATPIEHFAMQFDIHLFLLTVTVII